MVLSPTRELSIQTANVFNAVGSMMEGLEVQILIGGNSIDEDIQNLKNKHPQVVVGCPGRVFDMIRRNTFNSRKVKLVILDEADEMFSSGFKEQVYNIFQSLHKDIQVALFSATTPEADKRVSQEILNIQPKGLANVTQGIQTPPQITRQGNIQPANY
jgi:superfamily II DNA/RNA helicase